MNNDQLIDAAPELAQACREVRRDKAWHKLDLLTRDQVLSALAAIGEDESDKPLQEVELDGGVLQLDQADGTIRWIDKHGNTEGVWRPDDREYQDYRNYFDPQGTHDAHHQKTAAHKKRGRKVQQGAKAGRRRAARAD